MKLEKPEKKRQEEIELESKLSYAAKLFVEPLKGEQEIYGNTYNSEETTDKKTRKKKTGYNERFIN